MNNMRKVPGGPYTIRQRNTPADSWQTIHRNGVVYALDNHPDGKHGYVIEQGDPRLDLYAAHNFQEGRGSYEFQLIDATGNPTRSWIGALEYDHERYPRCVLLVVVSEN